MKETYICSIQDTLNKDANYCNYRPYTYLFYREVIFNLCYLYLFPHNCVQHDLPVIRYSGHLRGIRQMPLAVQKPHTFPKRHISSCRFSGGCVAHSFLFSFVDYYWVFCFMFLSFFKFHNKRWLFRCESSFNILQL